MGKIDRPSASIYRLRMVSGANSATDERGSVPVSAEVAAATQAKEPARAFLQSARRHLSDDELATPAARRFLIADLERLDERCTELQSYEQKYHDQRVTIATLTSQAETSKWNEILSFVCSSVGSAGLGAAPSYFALRDGTTLGYIMLGFSVVLLAAGVANRMFRWP